MVKKKYDLLNIEIGTFKRSNDKLSIKIDKSQFRYDSLSELVSSYGKQLYSEFGYNILSMKVNYLLDTLYD